MNTIIRIFNYRFYVREFLLLFFCYLLSEGIFAWLFMQNSSLQVMYSKIMSIGIFAFMLYSLRKLDTLEKTYVILFSVLMVKLVIESVFLYDNIFKQFTLYTVIYPVVFTVFVKYIVRSWEIDLLEFIARFYLFSYIVFMLLFGRQFSFGLEMIEMDDYGPFSGDSRVIHARSIYMIIIPFLWYLSKLVHTPKLKYFVLFLFCVTAILLHQHRSVWSSAIVAMVIYLLFNARSVPSSLKNIVQFLMIFIAVVVGGYFIIADLNPGMVNLFAERFEEILNPAKEGSTGNFRIDQRTIYLDYIKDKPITGWSFEGFNLSNPLVDWWDENTGHHFHEGFIEILFYHGIVGLLLKYSIIVIILLKAFRKKLTQEAIILVAFCVSGLLFSLNYVLPLIFWGHAGLCLFYLDKKSKSDDLYYNSSI